MPRLLFEDTHSVRLLALTMPVNNPTNITQTLFYIASFH